VFPGSARKVDIAFISKSVEYSEVLESSTKAYSTSILMSEKFVSLLSRRTKRECRQVDVRRFNENFVSDVYTLDIDTEALEALSAENSRSAREELVGGGTAGEDGDAAIRNMCVEGGDFDARVWRRDKTLAAVRRKFTGDFLDEWKDVFAVYDGGEGRASAKRLLAAFAAKHGDSVARALGARIVVVVEDAVAVVVMALRIVRVALCVVRCCQQSRSGLCR
jgi:hypothetical protein